MNSAQMGVLLRHIRTLAADPNSNLPLDGELLERFSATRDEDAFADLVHRHGPMVWSVCRHVLHNWHDAEDVFQATFLVLARKSASIYRPESLALAVRSGLSPRGQSASQVSPPKGRCGGTGLRKSEARHGFGRSALGYDLARVTNDAL
jgi:Sigma-70 region 2